MGSRRWPLWDPGHNGGEPLLGNPMCAVFYPGKSLLPAPLRLGGSGVRDPHTLLAFLGMIVLGRSFGLTWVGSCLVV